ncbi:hypothetical protein OAK54_00535, partial [Akkermansiaceae bacterium]|nr:hypothetical protein [Akkermansiaceae bacterium]
PPGRETFTVVTSPASSNLWHESVCPAPIFSAAVINALEKSIPITSLLVLPSSNEDLPTAQPTSKERPTLPLEKYPTVRTGKSNAAAGPCSQGKISLGFP